MFELIVFNNGHFHVVPTLRYGHPALVDEVFVYAGYGPDLQRFLALAETLISVRSGV